jgi:hypothetical protein
MKYLTRQEATAYLRKNGLTCGNFLLAQLAMTGEGPQFRYWGRRPIYTEDDLDVWIESRLSAPISSIPGMRRRAAPGPTDELGPPTHTSRPRRRRPRKQPAGTPQSLERA